MPLTPEGCPVNDLRVARHTRWWCDLLVPSGEGEVAQAGDAEPGAVDAVTFEAAVAENLPGLHADEYMLDAGTDLLMGLVACLFPVREFGLAEISTVWDDESGARAAAVGDRESLTSRMVT